MQTSRVKGVENVKEWEGKHGKMYYHNLVMENGDKINIGKKKQLQVGDELNYEITEVGQQEFNKAKSVAPEFKGNFSKGSKSNNASFALSYSKDYHSAIGGDVDTILATADKFKKWLDENS